ncbi:MAG: hypothetical protein OXF20_12370 [Gammaproteobacteria bacterium]|nr:hypothetical protein [Gammaproteobacteria bacterium]
MPKKNRFYDFENNEGGGWLALVMHFNQCSKAEALQWLRTHGLIEDRECQPTRQSKPHDPKPTPENHGHAKKIIHFI